MEHKPKLMTIRGFAIFGQAVKRWRDSQGWSQDKFIEVIEQRTGHRLVKSTLSRLENGGKAEWATLAVIVAARLVTTPFSDIPIDEYKVLDIVTEQTNPLDTPYWTPSIELATEQGDRILMLSSSEVRRLINLYCLSNNISANNLVDTLRKEIGNSAETLTRSIEDDSYASIPEYKLEFLAARCFVVKSWETGGVPIVNKKETYEGRIEKFRSDLIQVVD